MKCALLRNSSCLKKFPHHLQLISYQWYIQARIYNKIKKEQIWHSFQAIKEPTKVLLRLYIKDATGVCLHDQNMVQSVQKPEHSCSFHRQIFRVWVTSAGQGWKQIQFILICLDYNKRLGLILELGIKLSAAKSLGRAFFFSFLFFVITNILRRYPVASNLYKEMLFN